MKERNLTLNCASGEEVTKKQHACFVHNLIADLSKPKSLIQWRRSNSKDGIVYCSNGLAEGTLMTLRGLTDKPGVEFSYSRYGKLIYTATETDGDVNCDMHLAHLLHKVTCSVTLAEANKEPNPADQPRETIDNKYQSPQKELSGLRVNDMFRKVSADQMVDRLLRKPSMLSINVTEGSPEFARLETLIRAVVSYIQAIRPKESRYLLKGFALRSVTGDHRVCHHIMLSPMADVANAFVELDDKYYGGLKPAEQTEKYVADVVSNMLIGI